MTDDRLRDLEIRYADFRATVSVEVKQIRTDLVDLDERLESEFKTHEGRDLSNLRALWAAVGVSLGLNFPKAWELLQKIGVIP